MCMRRLRCRCGTDGQQTAGVPRGCVQLPDKQQRTHTHPCPTTLASSAAQWQVPPMQQPKIHPDTAPGTLSLAQGLTCWSSAHLPQGMLAKVNVVVGPQAQVRGGAGRNAGIGQDACCWVVHATPTVGIRCDALRRHRRSATMRAAPRHVPAGSNGTPRCPRAEDVQYRTPRQHQGELHHEPIPTYQRWQHHAQHHHTHARTVILLVVVIP